jgi:small basic protein
MLIFSWKLAQALLVLNFDVVYCYLVVKLPLLLLIAVIMVEGFRIIQPVTVHRKSLLEELLHFIELVTVSRVFVPY